MAIYVAAHRYLDLELPRGYVPLFVGAANREHLERKEGWLYDDAVDGAVVSDTAARGAAAAGDDALVGNAADVSAPASISAKNDRFCELTGLYWLWKHCNDDVIGLVHYRRFFYDAHTGSALSLKRAREVLGAYDAIVVQRSILHDGNMLLDSARYYRICHSSLDFRILKNVLEDDFPEYVSAFDECCARPWFHGRNMMIMTAELFDEYCAFLFGVLGRLEHAIDPYSYRDTYQRRVFGFLAERLLDVFLTQRGARIGECRTFDVAGKLEVDEDPASVTASFPDKAPFAARFFHPRAQGVDLSPVFDAAFCMQQWPISVAGGPRKPARAFEWFLREGAHIGLQAHPHFSIASYRNAHGELADVLGDDALAWCKYYVEQTYGAQRSVHVGDAAAGDDYAFGCENFDFTVGDCSAALEGEQGIDGLPLRAEDFAAARTRAARQGIVG